MANDYYSTLGLKRSATADEIRKAYRELARKYHPDLNADDASANGHNTGGDSPLDGGSANGHAGPADEHAGCHSGNPHRHHRDPGRHAGNPRGRNRDCPCNHGCCYLCYDTNRNGHAHRQDS